MKGTPKVAHVVVYTTVTLKETVSVPVDPKAWKRNGGVGRYKRTTLATLAKKAVQHVKSRGDVVTRIMDFIADGDGVNVMHGEMVCGNYTMFGSPPSIDKLARVERA